MIKTPFLITFILLISVVSAQSPFTITGSTNLVRNGKVVLIKNAPAEFYSSHIKNDTANIVNFQFQFEGVISYPQQFRIVFFETEGKYITQPFFIDTGNQKIFIDSSEKSNDILDFGLSIIAEGSKTNFEYNNVYLSVFASMNEKINNFFSEVNRCDSINDIELKQNCVSNTEKNRIELRKERDSLLFNYASSNRKSSLLPWVLYQAIKKHGFNEYHQKTYQLISEYTPSNIKKSIVDLINQQKNTSIGSLFPLSRFMKPNESSTYLANNKYTLVEFWYSGCIPCIAQFNVLKEVYSMYKKKGFEILAISIDGKKSLPKYRRILNQYKYSWQQFLDLDGNKTKQLNIYKFPTNYLLDRHGKIIFKDIDPTMLSEFLRKEL